MPDGDGARRARAWERRAQHIGLGIGWMLAVSGATWAPWVERPAAALVLTAPDLAEFVKFLPEVRSGALAIQRLFFLAPLFLVTSGTPWIFGSALMPGLPLGLHVLTRLLMLPLALLLLPPVWNPVVLISEEFRLQTAGCVVCLMLALLWRSHWHMPRYVGLLWSLGWVVAPLLALWQFMQAQPAIAHAYAALIVPGWGSWAACGGGLLMSCVLWWEWHRAHHRETRRAVTTDDGSR